MSAAGSAAPASSKVSARLVRYQRDANDEEIDSRPLEFGLLRRLFAYTRPYASKRNWLAAVVLLRSMQLPSLVWATSKIIGGPILRADQPGIWWGMLGFAALALFTIITMHFRSRLAMELGEAVVHDLRADIFRHLMRLPMGFFHKTKLGRIIGRVTSDVESVRSGVQDVLFVSVVQMGQMLGAAVFMLFADWVMFSLVLALAPILWAINRHFRGRLTQATREAQESFSRVTATLAESVNGIRVTQGFVRQDVNGGLFRNLIQDHSRYNLDIARTSAVFQPLLEFNTQLFIAALLIFGGYRTFSHSMEIGDLLQFFFLAGMFFSPIQVIAGQYNQALTAMAGAERVFRLLDTKPEWEDAPDAKPLPPIQGRIELRGLSFGYDPKTLVLRDVDFTAEPGQTIALVGHTGSGKSSIINLIAKFYLPTSGELLIDGHEIRSVTSASLHKQMGIVLQSNFLFTGTVMDNIRVGRVGATDAEVVEAAHKLDCLDLIEALPDGFATPVGERGSGLSLGQRQVICFTRAMLADPRIMILDEATSSIDGMTEAKLQKALATLLRGRTSFVVAHRLSTIRHADLVLVLDDGRIVERGTHNFLLVQDGVYANLYRQFAQSHEPD